MDIDNGKNPQNISILFFKELENFVSLYIVKII